MTNHPNRSKKDGPVQKFQLIKRYGRALRDAGYEPQKMSCAELREAIKKISHYPEKWDLEFALEKLIVESQ